MDLVGDESHWTRWEKPGMMSFLWVLLQPGSLSSKIPQQGCGVGGPSSRAWEISFGLSWVHLETQPGCREVPLKVSVPGVPGLRWRLGLLAFPQGLLASQVALVGCTERTNTLNAWERAGIGDVL